MEVYIFYLLTCMHDTLNRLIQYLYYKVVILYIYIYIYIYTKIITVWMITFINQYEHH